MLSKKQKKVLGLFLRSRSKSGTLTIRRSGMLRSYKIGSRRFDTFATRVFLRLARSCRVVEKFDKKHRFFMIFCDRVPRSERSYRISPQRGRISSNKKYSFAQCIEVHACAITASGSIGASSSVVTTVGFC